MPSTAQIIIEVDDAGAIAAFKNVDAASKQNLGNMEGGAKNAAAALDSITPALGRIGAAHREGREAAVLLTEELGIRMPRALANVLSDTKLIGPALQLAFSGVAIGAMAGLLIEVGKRIFDLYENTVNLRSEFEALDKIEKQLTTDSLSLANGLIQGNARLTEFSSGPVAGAKAKIAALGMEITDLGKLIDINGKQFNDLGTSAKAALREFLVPTQAADLAGTLKNVGLEIQRIKSLLLNTEGGTTDSLALQESLRSLVSFYDVLSLKVQKFNQGVAIGGGELQKILAQLAKESAEEAQKTATAIQEASDKLQAMTDAANKFGLKGAELIAADTTALLTKAEEEWSKFPMLAAKGSAAETAILAKDSRERLALLQTEGEKASESVLQMMDEDIAARKKNADDRQRLAEKLRRMEDQTIMAERAAAIAAAPPWERANATIVANYQERMAKIREALATGDLDSQHAAREAAAAWTDAFSAMRDKLASDMQSLFDDITSGNIGQRFKKLFEQMVFQMVATWILGMQQMRSASSGAMGGGGGGILGAIFGSLGLGGIFGGGGGGQGGISGLPGVITNFAGGGGAPNASLGDLAGLGMASGMPSFSSGVGGGLSGSGETATEGGLGSALFGSLGLSAGGGAGSGTILPSGAGASTGAGGLLGQLKGLLSSPALQGTAGLALLASSFGKGGLLAGLMGAAGGGLATFAALSPLLAAGPIGWLVVGIGALVGFLGGFFQKSTKKARLAIEANIKAQSQKVEDAYNSFQMDFPTSNTQLEALRQQGVDALKQAGVKDISRSRVGHVDQWVDKAEKEIAVTEAERVRRAAIAFGPAEFRVGGLVGPGAGGPVPSWFAGSAMHFAGGGAVPAFLHEGEYVMRPEAVSRIGAGNLSRMNSGGGGGGEVHNHFHINALDAKSVVELFRRMQSEGSW